MLLLYVHDYSTRLLGVWGVSIWFNVMLTEKVMENEFCNVGDISFRYSKVLEEKITS